MKEFSSNCFFYVKKQKGKMPRMWLFRCHKMGKTWRSSAVQVQKLWQPVHIPPQGHQQSQPVCVVRVVDLGQTDHRANIRIEWIQHETAVPLVRRIPSPPPSGEISWRRWPAADSSSGKASKPAGEREDWRPTGAITGFRWTPTTTTPASSSAVSAL